MSRQPKDAAALGAARNDCGKIAYDARWKAKKAEREGRKIGLDHMAVYECADCGLWHCGHSNRLTRHSPLKAQSVKRAREQRQRRELVADLLAERPTCQIRWDDNCTRVATEVDEKCGRGRGGDFLDRDNCQTSCHNCHRLKTDNPAEARARGLEVSSADSRARKDTA